METTFDFDKNMEYALNHIGGILLKNTKLLDKFRKKLYTGAFETYKEESRPVFEAIEKACVVKEEEKEQILLNCVNRALKDFETYLEKMGKLKRKNELDLCKMVLALFTIPMIQELKLDISDAYVDLFMEKWIEAYPDYVFKKGTYEDLLQGFEKKGFCYITTAVCETKGKTDDCYELVMFRDFRDNYLMKEESGRILVEQYYERAPKILAAIYMGEDPGAVLADVWERHLSVCLNNIENGQNALCRQNYQNMIEEMENKYIS